MRKLLLTAMLGTFSAMGYSQNYTIRITISDEKKQTITGFGAAAIENLMRPTDDVDVIRKAFEPNSPIGLNILRVEMSPNMKGDVTAADVGWDTPYDWKGSIPAVKEAKKHGAIVFATPWSPPAELKTNNSSSGGKTGNDDEMRGTLNDPSQLFPWFNLYMKYMKRSGAPVDFVSFQNEPDWWVNYSGCLYTPQEMYSVIKNYHNDLKKADYNVGFIAGEPLGFNPDYYRSLISDPETNDFCDVYAGHVYGNYGCMKNIATVAKLAPGKEIWMTEHTVHGDGRYIPDWNEELAFAEDVNECLINGCTGYIYWYLCKEFGFIYDGKQYDSADCANENGRKRGDILNRGYVMGQFARNLKGATLLKHKSSLADGKENGQTTTGVNKEFEMSAFQLGDSIIVNAINNRTTANNFQMILPYKATSLKRIQSTEGNLCVEDTPAIEEGTTFSFSVPAKSFCTFIYHIDDGTNGIEDVKTYEQSAAVKDRRFYTLNGQRVEKPERGVYIQNGRKIFVW